MQLKTSGRVALIVFAVLVMLAVLAPLISPYDPWEMNLPYQPPGEGHLLGTNDLGQDILSELIYGCRVSMFIGIASSLIVTALGSALGIASAYYGGTVDRVIMGVTSIGMTVPSLPLTIVLVAFFRPSMWNIIAAICITGWTSTARIIRSRTLQIKEMPYIQNARMMSGSGLYVMTRHILSNVGELVFVKGSLSVASAMLTEASLAYLGLGSPLYKSWGMILRDAFNSGGILNGYWWWYVPPIICICVSIFTVSSLSGGIGYSK